MILLSMSTERSFHVARFEGDDLQLLSTHDTPEEAFQQHSAVIDYLGEAFSDEYFVVQNVTSSSRCRLMEGETA